MRERKEREGGREGGREVTEKEGRVWFGRNDKRRYGEFRGVA